jgi:hypothetical protein
VRGLAIVGLLLAAACGSTSQMKRPDGSTEFYLSCGAWFSSWNGCYDEANKICPTGWTKISEDSSWANGKEMRFSCPGPSNLKSATSKAD